MTFERRGSKSGTNKNVRRLCREKTRGVEAHLATAVTDNRRNVSINALNHKTRVKENFLYWMAGET